MQRRAGLRPPDAPIRQVRGPRESVFEADASAESGQTGEQANLGEHFVIEKNDISPSLP